MKPTPLWQSIAIALREDLALGSHRLGEKLPTEAALALRFGVNRHTVRHALAALADEGSLHARRGAGVFVTSAPTDYPIDKRVRFHRNLEAAGRAPGKRILSTETRGATETEATALNLAPGDTVYSADGLSTADGAPIALFRSVFPGWLPASFPAALTKASSVTAALRLAGIPDYTRASTRLTALSATTVQAGHLRLKEAAPLIYSEAINHAPDGRPVEYGLTWFAGERVTLNILSDESAPSHP